MRITDVDCSENNLQDEYLQIESKFKYLLERNAKNIYTPKIKEIETRLLADYLELGNFGSHEDADEIILDKLDYFIHQLKKDKFLSSFSTTRFSDDYSIFYFRLHPDIV